MQSASDTRTNESCHVLNEACFGHTYEWVTSHAWMSHVVGTIRFRHTYEWVMSHIRMYWRKSASNSHTNESYHVLNEVCFGHTQEWMTSHAWNIHVLSETVSNTLLNELCHVSEWVMYWMQSASDTLIKEMKESHARMSHELNGICLGHTYEWDMSCTKWNPLWTHARISDVKYSNESCTDLDALWVLRITSSG